MSILQGSARTSSHATSCGQYLNNRFMINCHCFDGLVI
uniref:Uncharacterized protein n=1 Tax=Arundo donax TaxID=35708 RepID=A0A0A8YVY8_ARUDO